MDDPKPPSHNCEQEAAKLSFDVTKQFLTLAIGGIAFVVGVSFSSPNAISSFLLWFTIVVFGLSAAFGLFFLLHGVNTLSVQKSYDIYATSLRWLAGLQIVLVLFGVVLLVPILLQRRSPPTVKPVLDELNPVSPIFLRALRVLRGQKPFGNWELAT